MKIGFVSLGCPKNLVDGEVMLGYARDAGHEITPDADGADVIVVNTCAFIDRAKEESVDAILEMAQRKRDGGCKRLVVTGCLAERYRDQLKKEIPEIDVVLGTGEVPEIVGALDGHQPTPAPVTLFRSAEELMHGGHAAPTYLYSAETPRLLTTPRHYAYVKVAEGCDYTCAFCIIPRLRGQYRSRSADEIVREAEQLGARGVKELLLISQDTTFYGNDLGERGALGRLLRRLNAVAGIEWIRLLYLYPTTIDAGMIDEMAECDKVVKYIDLPLQHASDAVLKRMRRPGTRKSYERLLDNIRTRIPDVSLRTTFIVGFPGETEADFEQLSGFVTAVGFDHVGVFTYSHEEGTRAGEWDDDVPASVKRKRRERLMATQAAIVERAQEARIGQRVRVMVDGPSADHELVLRGRLASQAPDIDPLVYLTECDPSAYAAGQLIEGEVVGAQGYDLLVRPA